MGVPELRWSPSPEPEHQFFIIREGTPATPPPREPYSQPNSHLQPQYHHNHYQHLPTPSRENAASPPPVACFMERTDSGHTILTEPDLLSPGGSECLDSSEFRDPDDIEAAKHVRQHLRTPRGTNQRHERILRTLINPPGIGADFALDNAALESIFSAADALFFQGRLSRRVQWEWSHGAVNIAGNQQQQQAGGSRIIGTTALRKAKQGGYETLIVLSSPILTDTSYNRRLLISTFLHELIHSYLFIYCGFKARHCGGHTKGFREIAATIDQWVGHKCLRLGDMEADLKHFHEDAPRSSVDDEVSPIYFQDVHSFFDDDSDNSLSAPWSTGPKVVFGAAERGADKRWSAPTRVSHTSSPMLPGSPFAAPFAEHGGWDACDISNNASHCSDVRSNTFPGVAVQLYPLY